MRFVFTMALLALAGCAAQGQEVPSKTSSGNPDSPDRLTHAVFFELKQNDDASIQALIDGAYKYLAPHDGIEHFSAGPRHTQYQRDVNDQEFDVALTVVFETTDAQEVYQITQMHKQFIAEHEGNWKSVRVFDSRAPAIKQ